MSAFTKPILVDAGGEVLQLERLSLGAGTAGQITERWLQETLFCAPKALPASEVDPHIGMLIPVCMELETGAGPADILYVTPTGQIVVVETKLWRNPEARREVVGQVLDYAKQLTSWTYGVLEQSAALAAKRSPKGFLLETVSAHTTGLDSAAFVDAIERSLRTGDFLLLIVGDGIRLGAESLVTFLERYGHMSFKLGLLEVAIYQMPGGGRLLQPRVLAKTEILQRTVLIGPSGPVLVEQAAQGDDAPDNSAQRDWYRAFWSEFLIRLQAIDSELGGFEPANSTNQFFPMPPSGSKAWISAYIAQSSGKAGAYLTFAKAYEQGLTVYEMLLADRDAIDSEFGGALSWERDGDKVYVSAPTVRVSNLNNTSDRSRALDHLAQHAVRLIRVLRPRLEAASRAAAN